MSTIFSRNNTSGLSLVELMVAITISTILLLGVTSVYLSTRHSNAVEDELSRMQENGRFAINLMSKEIRQAGYEGCTNLKRITPVNNVKTGKGASATVDTNYNLTSGTALVGHTGCTGGTGAGCSPATPVGTLPVIAGTEALTIRRTSSCASELTGNMGVLSAQLQTVYRQGCDFAQDQVLVITDCSSADIFRTTNNPLTGGKTVGDKINVAHANTNNMTNFLSKLYDTNARIMQWERHTYYIAPCSSGVAGCRSLWVDVDQGATDVATELVEYIDDLQIDYHVDKAFSSTSDPSVDAFMTAAQVQAGNLWGNVLAVRIHLLATTRDNVANQNNGKNATPYTFMGVKKTSTDRRYRREFTTTINIRNRTL